LQILNETAGDLTVCLAARVQFWGNYTPKACYHFLSHIVSAEPRSADGVPFAQKIE